MSPSVYDGRVVRERHTHYAADGETVTGYTVVEREPEWTERDRHEAEGLLYYEATRCSSCGNDLHVSLEEGHAWEVDNETVCHACAALESVKRAEQREHENDKPAPGRPGYLDGRIYTVREYFE